MGKIYGSITELVGKTPLLEIKNYSASHGLKARILVKLEYYNPAQSVKDRIALSMIEDAEKKGLLKPGGKIVELTSGNTGIGAAAIAAAKGYKFRAYVQDTVSRERFQVIRAYGGEAVKLSDEPVLAKALKESNNDIFAALKALKEDIAAKADGTYVLDQGTNPANPAVHEAATGPEIWEDTAGEVDYFIACVGTGGTVSGAGKFLKSKNPDIKIVAIQPGPDSLPNDDNPVVEEEITGVHAFEGVPENLIPETFDRNIYDERFDVEAKEAYKAAREVAKSDGILVGTSSGAAIYAATKIAQRPENEGKTIVAVLPDTGLRYLSTNLFNEDFEV